MRTPTLVLTVVVLCANRHCFRANSSLAVYPCGTGYPPRRRWDKFSQERKEAKDAVSAFVYSSDTFLLASDRSKSSAHCTYVYAIVILVRTFQLTYSNRNQNAATRGRWPPTAKNSIAAATATRPFRLKLAWGRSFVAGTRASCSCRSVRRPSCTLRPITGTAATAPAPASFLPMPIWISKSNCSKLATWWRPYRPRLVAVWRARCSKTKRRK